VSAPVRLLAILAVFALALVGALEFVDHEIQAHPGSAPFWATGSLTVSSLALATWLFVHLRDRRRKKQGAVMASRQLGGNRHA
jgi:hypothetical protein